MFTTIAFVAMTIAALIRSFKIITIQLDMCNYTFKINILVTIMLLKLVIKGRSR